MMSGVKGLRGDMLEMAEEFKNMNIEQFDTRNSQFDGTGGSRGPLSIQVDKDWRV